MSEELRARLERGRHLIPDHMWDGVLNYYLHRYQPGHFMTALLENDLMETMARADDINARRIQDWCVFLYNHVPRGSYGSPEAVRRWLNPEEVSDDPQG